MKLLSAFMLGLFSTTLCHTGWAQGVDIPLFFDDDEAPAPSTTIAEETKEPQTTTTPNIGRKAIPLHSVTLTPPPLPPVTVDLSELDTDEEPPVESPETSLPNTRQEKIILPVNTTNTSPSTPPSSTEQTIPINTQDVRGFDIEGLALGMNLDEAIRLATQKGYVIQKTKKAFPLYRTTYYEDLCKQMGYHTGYKIRLCMQNLGKKENSTYTQDIILSKPNSRESFEFKATSSATDNLIWQIIYRNMGDNSLNFTPKNAAKKQARKQAFFNAVFDKFGYPDDSEKLIWGNPQDAYMQVYFGGSNYDASITLTDYGISDEDYFMGEDWRMDHTPMEHFSFED